MDELTTQKPESEGTNPQAQNTELTNSPQIQSAEAVEAELAYYSAAIASAEVLESAGAVLFHMNSDDVSAENTLDSQNSGITKFEQKQGHRIVF